MLAITLGNLKKKVVELGIPEYFSGLNDAEILELGLYFYEKHIETNLTGIKRDMGIDEVPETRDDWDEDDEIVDESLNIPAQDSGCVCGSDDDHHTIECYLGI